MKIEMKDAPTGFKPVVMTITFETQDELLNVWGRMNVHPGQTVLAGNLDRPQVIRGIEREHERYAVNPLWKVLDIVAKANNII